MNLFPLVSYPGCLLWDKSGFICEWRLQQTILVPKCLLALALLQLGVLRAGQAVQSCLWLCSRVRFSLSLLPEQCDDDRASGGLALLLVWPHFGWGSQVLQDWPFMRATLHLSLLSAAACASLYLTELCQSQPLLCDTTYADLCPLWCDFPPGSTRLCHFSAEYGLWSSLNWSSRSSWFPPVCINGTKAWRIMNGFCEQDSPQFYSKSTWEEINLCHNSPQLYSKSTWGAIHLCHPGGTVRKPWVAPRVSNCSYSHPLEISRRKLSPVNREMNPLQTSTFLS